MVPRSFLLPTTIVGLMWSGRKCDWEAGEIASQHEIGKIEKLDEKRTPRRLKSLVEKRPRLKEEALPLLGDRGCNEREWKCAPD